MSKGFREVGAGRLALVLLLGLLTAQASGQAAQATTVTIGGEARFEKNGPVFFQLLALNASAEEVVAREQIITPTSEDLTRRRLRFAFADLVPGRYALKAFQDTNGNGRIDISLFGPKEPWATHRPARPKLRPPRFEEMAFEATASVTDIELVLR